MRNFMSGSCCTQLGSPFGSLGTDSPQQWYLRAKRAVATFDVLKQRYDALPSGTEKRAILEKIGTKDNDSSWMYRYLSVASDVAQVEGYTPLNYEIYASDHRQNRVPKLEDNNAEFGQMMAIAEAKAGIQPITPEIITREVIKQVPVVIATEGTSTPATPVPNTQPQGIKPSTIAFYAAGGFAVLGLVYLMLGKR